MDIPWWQILKSQSPPWKVQAISARVDLVGELHTALNLWGELLIIVMATVSQQEIKGIKWEWGDRGAGKLGRESWHQGVIRCEDGERAPETRGREWEEVWMQSKSGPIKELDIRHIRNIANGGRGRRNQEWEKRTKVKSEIKKRPFLESRKTMCHELWSKMNSVLCSGVQQRRQTQQPWECVILAPESFVCAARRVAHLWGFSILDSRSTRGGSQLSWTGSYNATSKVRWPKVVIFFCFIKYSTLNTQHNIRTLWDATVELSQMDKIRLND